MDPDQLRAGLIEQERFSPDLDTVRERVRRVAPRATAHSRHRIVLIRRLAIAASVAVVAILTGVIAVVHYHSQPTRPALPPPSVVGGIRWELTSAAISGMPNYGGAPQDPESLYLYPDGTSVATGFCLARQGKWRQRGTEVIFSDQSTLDHSCPIGMNSTALRLALLQLDGPMNFTIAANILHLRNSTTTMTFKAAGDAANNPGPSTGASADPIPAALTGFAWQLSSAVQDGKNIALSPDKPTTMTLYADGTSTMAGPACFYRTGRWHQVTGGIRLTDQVSVAMFCYRITDQREEAGPGVLTGLVGDLTMTVTQHTLTLQNAHTAANFTDAGVTTGGPASSDTPKSSR
ncbi:hypothetical protein SAMN04515671_1447 [Nakamurella panacisegetis]|uniref:META domain-containing protein n=1 Tax=Nakamurella panacisegetis TaxID=1090615 RepID=A0A1H0KW35_9ACTN|nr:hypothetical protein [Nakamurella panacisegetis]SDO59991.1 hypothetical protein SAMN04515671_1447 [Nakamurella panacisegetis]